MGKLYVLDHPLIQHKISMMRKIETTTKDFRELANEISSGTKVIEEKDYYRDVKKRKGMKLMTRISMSVSDMFHMVKMICLRLS